MTIFDQFTGKYQLSKTLRFELKPAGKMVFDERVEKKVTATEKFLRDNKVFEKDKTIDESYNQAKFYFDTLHQKFIDAALAPSKVEGLPLEKFAGFLEKENVALLAKRGLLNEARIKKEVKKVDSLQKEIKDIEQEVANGKKRLYNAIRVLFDKEAEVWKGQYQGKVLENGEKIKFSKTDIKQKGISFLTAAGILQILKYEFPESKEAEFQKKGYPSLYVGEQENPGKQRYIFNSFEKFIGYLSRFQQTRDHLYADDSTSTAVATRIVSNFEIFLANAKAFNEKYKQNQKHKKIGFNETHIFEIDHYQSCLLQKGIEALDQEQNNDTSYNKIIGRINQRIKEYRGKATSEVKQKKEKSFSKSDYPLFKTLDKQILGKVEKERQLIEEVGDKEKENKIFLQKFQEFIVINEERFSKARSFMGRFFYDEFAPAYDSVYMKNATINTISRRWFAEGYGRDFELLLPQKSKNRDEKDESKVKQFVTLADIKNVVEQLEGKPFKQTYYDERVFSAEQKSWEQFLMIWKYEFNSLFSGIKGKDGSVALIGYDESLEEAKKLKAFVRKPEEIPTVKNYADASLRIFQLMKYLALDERDKGKTTGQLNTDFYAQLDEYAKDFEFVKYYNAFRNFVTKKPFDEESIKLNFDKGNLLGGWAESPKGNAQFCGYILRRDGRYFLAISKFTHFLDIEKYKLSVKQTHNCYQKLEYTALDWGKNITGGQVYPSFTKQKLGKSLSYKEHKKQLKDREHVAFIKTLIKEKYLNKFSKLADFLAADYKTVKEMQDVFSRLQLGGMKFISIRADWVDGQKIEENGKTHQLFLFEILNRDLRSHSAPHKENIHTLYWNALFSKENLQKIVFNLLGNAEIFFRKATPDLPVRKNKRGHEYIDKHGRKIVEGRRYSRDLIRLHIPISLNFSQKSLKNKQFNKEINQLLFRYPNVNVIGIDRGEKHLVYYSVINQKGEILDQGSLNKINGVDYHQKLIEREKERLANRQSWEPVAKIKDLKRGYVSQVVRKIVNLVIEYNAIVVMEDLNMRFKQIRSGIERSVYQQLEKQLIDKFGYLIFKDRGPQESGGVLKGYQLSAPFVSFEKMGKQTGIIFYTQADYTSVTDPLTGFRKNIYISNSASQEKVKDALQKFKAIGWDDEEKSYFFVYNPVDFVDEKNKGNTFFKEWTVYANVPRIRREKGYDGYWTYKPIDVNAKLKELFELWDFENPAAEDIKKEIARKEADGELRGKREFDDKEKNFYESFIYLFNLVLQLRNSFSLQIEAKDEKAEG